MADHPNPLTERSPPRFVVYGGLQPPRRCDRRDRPEQKGTPSRGSRSGGGVAARMVPGPAPSEGEAAACPDRPGVVQARHGVVNPRCSTLEPSRAILRPPRPLTGPQPRDQPPRARVVPSAGVVWRPRRSTTAAAVAALPCLTVTECLGGQRRSTAATTCSRGTNYTNLRPQPRPRVSSEHEQRPREAGISPAGGAVLSVSLMRDQPRVNHTPVTNRARVTRANAVS